MIETASRFKVRESAFWQAYGRRRYTILFYSLLLMLVAMPVASTLGLFETTIKLLVFALLLAAVMPSATGRTRYALPLLVLALVAAQFASEAGDLPISPGLVALVVALIGLSAAAAALRFALNSAKVNSEEVHAALSTYLLAGLFVGQIYFALDTLWPGSVTGPDDFSQQDAVYFSFITLASLGYGDFLPRTDLARGIATFEVIGGQLYLAVLVARLIGAFGVQKN